MGGDGGVFLKNKLLLKRRRQHGLKNFKQGQLTPELFGIFRRHIFDVLFLHTY